VQGDVDVLDRPRGEPGVELLAVEIADVRGGDVLELEVP
jgi:hypothetical protein